MIRKINGKEFNRHVNGNVVLKPFKGSNSKDMLSYMVPTLDREVADVADFNIGTNETSIFRKYCEDYH